MSTVVLLQSWNPWIRHSLCLEFGSCPPDFFFAEQIAVCWSLPECTTLHMWTCSHLVLFVHSQFRWLYGVGVMALPTLQSYYMTRKGRPQPERLIVQRRTHESDVKQKWTEHSRYFHSSEVQSLKQEAWTSTKSFQDRYMCPFWLFNSPLLSV